MFDLGYLRCLFAAAMAASALAMPAFAGDGSYEPDDTEEHGAPFFGEVKDIRTFDPVQGVLIRMQLRGTSQFIVFHSDADGRFRRPGLGPDVDPDKVDVICEKPGYKSVDVIRRRVSSTKDAPVEVECLMQRN